MIISYMAIPGIKKKEISFHMSKKDQIEIIKNTVCEYFGVHMDCLNEITNKRKCADARHVSYYFVHKLSGLSLVDTALEFNRHHTTIIHGKSKISDLMFSDPVFKLEMHYLGKSIEFELANAKYNIK